MSAWERSRSRPRQDEEQRLAYAGSGRLGSMYKLGMLAVLFAGCSAQLRGVPKNWDHASDPRCTTSIDRVVADGAIATLIFTGGFLAADQTGDRKTAAVVALGAAFIGGIFAIAATAGYSKVDDCRQATETWRIAQATAARERRGSDWFCDPEGSCTRDRTSCEQSSGSCTAADTAWCFATPDGERCFAAPDTCWPEQRQAGDTATSGCQRR